MTSDSRSETDRSTSYFVDEKGFPTSFNSTKFGKHKYHWIDC